MGSCLLLSFILSCLSSFIFSCLSSFIFSLVFHLLLSLVLSSSLSVCSSGLFSWSRLCLESLCLVSLFVSSVVTTKLVPVVPSPRRILTQKTAQELYTPVQTQSPLCVLPCSMNCGANSAPPGAVGPSCAANAACDTLGSTRVSSFNTAEAVLRTGKTRAHRCLFTCGRDAPHAKLNFIASFSIVERRPITTSRHAPRCLLHSVSLHHVTSFLQQATQLAFHRRLTTGSPTPSRASP